MSLYDSLPEQQRPDGGWYGMFASNVGDLNSLARVVIPSFDSDLVFERVRWQSRDDASLPARGDECLVVFDDRRQPWVVAWWPFSS